MVVLGKPLRLVLVTLQSLVPASVVRELNAAAIELDVSIASDLVGHSLFVAVFAEFQVGLIDCCFRLLSNGRLFDFA